MSRFPHDRDHPLLDPQSDRPLDILLLEDNEVDALVFEGTARRYSQPIHVRWTSTLKEFETALGERLPDIICADHLLPDGIATQALQVRNQVERDIPFLVITGAGEEDVAVDYMRLGASDYLSKRRLKEFGLVLDVLLRGYRNRA